ncbi:hypothetical protein B296_00056059, partial [Ensete ventricosum]
MKIGKVTCYYFVPACFDSKEVPDDMNIFFQITLASSWTFEDLKAAVAGIDSLNGISEINLKYADRLLPGGIADWGCFCPSKSTGNNRFRQSVVDFGQYQLREKEEEGEEKPGVRLLFAYAIRHPHDPSLTFDFFSPHGEKKRLPVWEKEQGN